jgi:hypothetical protein
MEKKVKLPLQELAAVLIGFLDITKNKTIIKELTT